MPLQVLLAGDRPMLQNVQNRALPQTFIHNEYLFTKVNKYFLSYGASRKCQAEKTGVYLTFQTPPIAVIG